MANIGYNNLYLKHASINGFKSILKMDVNFLNGLNVVIGRNGAGKSNLFDILKEGLRILGLPQDTHIKSLSIGMESIEGKELFEVDFERKALSQDDIELNPTKKYFFNRTYKFNGSYISSKSRGTLDFDSVKVEGDNVILARHMNYNYILRKLNLIFPNVILLSYSMPSNLNFIESPGKIIADYDLFEVDHSRTLDFLNLFFWKLENELLNFFDEESLNGSGYESVEKITPDFIKSNLVFGEDLVSALSKYTPIQNIRFNSNINVYYDRNLLIIENVKMEFFVNETWLPWSHLSDGTKRLFYIVSQIEGMVEDIVLLEEPELGIHPHQFHLLMQFIREKSDNNQIIISTHSPLVLNYINNEELDRIQIASYTKDKGTQLRRLTDREQKKAKTYVEEVGFLSDYWVYSDLEE